MESQQIDPDSIAKSTTPLAKYLTYYDNLTAPEYAVLVTGSWGTGKSHQVKAVIPDCRRYYVSLFGMQSASDIFAAVFAQMFPKKAWTKKNTEDAKGANIMGIPVGAVGQSLANNFIREQVNTDRTIIFDDLERCKIDPTEILGVINRYVEHHKCRVVVIAHDGKLKDDFIGQKEKLFGRELRVKPDIESAYGSFIEYFSKNLKEAGVDALTEFKEQILSIFKDSETKSLRILRHVMEDIVRLAGCFSANHRANKVAYEEAIGVLTALSFECRAERMKMNDILARDSIAWRYQPLTKENSVSAPIVIAYERYRTVALESTILSSATLEAMLFDGVFDETLIRADLDQSSYFMPADHMPAWKIFLNFQSESDDVVLPAIATLNEEFETRALHAPGEMLHLFAIRLMMATNGIIPKSVDEVYSECINYIDDLLAKYKLPPAPLERDTLSTLRNGTGGYSYWVEPAYEVKFQAIFEYLQTQRAAALKRQLPRYSAEILSLVENDGKQIFQLLNHTGYGSGKFADVPILIHINPVDFANAWLKAHPRQWHNIALAIQERFKYDNKNLFKEEHHWAQQVKDILINETNKSSQLISLRMRRVLKYITIETNDIEVKS